MKGKGKQRRAQETKTPLYPGKRVQRRMKTSVVPLCLQPKSCRSRAGNGAKRRALAGKMPLKRAPPGWCGPFAGAAKTFSRWSPLSGTPGANARPVRRIFNMKALYPRILGLSRAFFWIIPAVWGLFPPVDLPLPEKTPRKARPSPAHKGHSRSATVPRRR